jgi:hypothetical protein
LFSDLKLMSKHDNVSADASCMLSKFRPEKKCIYSKIEVLFTRVFYKVHLLIQATGVGEFANCMTSCKHWHCCANPDESASASTRVRSGLFARGCIVWWGSHKAQRGVQVIYDIKV